MAASCAKRSSGWFLSGLGLAALLTAVIVLPATAQTLVVSPDCGIAGQTLVTIKGSGWAEPDPPCEYVFYFNGSEVAPRQDDGLYGPPLATFTVPSVAAGKYRVRVELRITETQALIQCREAEFCVISQEQDPWANAMTVQDSSMNIKFDPTNVCDVTPCTDIMLLQTVNLKRQIGTGSPTQENFSRFDPTYTFLDATRVNGITIDHHFGDADPYANGEVDAWDQRLGSPGTKSCEFSVESKLKDTPHVAEELIQPGETIIMEFEVNAFCAAGDDRGSWLGKVTWTWSKTRGQPPVVTPGTMSRNGPSAGFSSALGGWQAGPQHSFDLPTPKSPTSGGLPCQ